MRTGTNSVEVTVRRGALVGWVADRSVGTKNLIGIALMALVAIGVGILSITSMAQLNDRLGQLKSRHLESIEQLVVIRQGVSENYRGQSLFSWSAYDPSVAPRADKAVEDGDAMIDAAVAKYRTRLAGSAAREAALNDFAKAWTDYSNLRDVVVFQKTAPAGATVPTDPAARNTLWQDLEGQMNTALAKLQQQEIVESGRRTSRATSPGWPTPRTPRPRP
ncbi:MCP four helix bundle domain-containing protein [Dactylosporangium sp. NPDC050688]|uniref:MCP four helix bundle domain-containing protein n=1 Tax=Dactylosporangium sp. NPDC050688 TaxID=3157217 RepID=UPI00340BB3C2